MKEVDAFVQGTQGSIKKGRKLKRGVLKTKFADCILFALVFVIVGFLRVPLGCN